ncbi:MAG: hypothetical protein ACTSXV_00165 [Alphaproteobacteria bacterium]
MKKIFLILVLATSALSAKTLEFEFGVSTYSHEYEEPNFMKEEGTFVEINGAITYRKDFMARLEVRNGKGKVDYKGSGTTKNVPDVLYEYRALVGKDFISGNYRWTPYFGYGERTLNDDSSAMISDTGSIGYERESKYLYIPLGLTLERRFAGWAISPTIEYDYFLEGRQKSNLAYLTPILGTPYYDIENKQVDGNGFKLKLKFIKDFKNDTQMSFELFYHQWSIDDSQLTIDPDGSAWLEPKNNTKQFGVRVGYMF